jgi:protein-tyrosine-phosphatase
MMTVAVAGGSGAQNNDGTDRARIVFVCEHGAAKSVIAAAYFNKLAAERGLRDRATYRGVSPQPELSAAALKGLRDDGLTAPAVNPAAITPDDVTGATHIFAIGCSLPAHAKSSGKADNCAVVSVTSFASVARAQEIPAVYQQVLDALGRTGDFKDNVLKVNIPRNDLAVTVANVKTPTPFGFGGWVAMTKGTGGMDVMMGDLVLTQEEVSPVMSALLDNGLEVTALHNHFFWDEPRMFYMHVHGHGTPADLARKVKPALDLIGKGANRPPAAPAASPAAPSASAIDTARIAQITGHQGDQNGTVYKITVGRDDLKLTEMGAPINARMGLNTWAAFVGTNDNAAVAGDVAMLANEVTPVLKVLRQNGIDIVAIHHHMTGTSPTIYFLHYWGTGPADKLASAFKAALSELGKKGTSSR